MILPKAIYSGPIITIIMNYYLLTIEWQKGHFMPVFGTCVVGCASKKSQIAEQATSYAIAFCNDQGWELIDSVLSNATKEQYEEQETVHTFK